MTEFPIPDGLTEVVADARAERFDDDRIETFWGNKYAFRPTDDGRLKVWEWYGADENGPDRGFLTTFTLAGHDDETVARQIVSEYAWAA